MRNTASGMSFSVNVFCDAAFATLPFAALPFAALPGAAAPFVRHHHKFQNMVVWKYDEHSKRKLLSPGIFDKFCGNTRLFEKNQFHGSPAEICRNLRYLMVGAVNLEK
jgi:hypothetical protein